MAHPWGVYLARRAVRKAGKEVVLEHLGTKRQRRRGGELVVGALEDSPIQTHGPLADLL